MIIISALRFNLEDAHPEPVRTEVQPENHDIMRQSSNSKIPTTYLLTASDLGLFAKYPDLIEDRGIKDHRKGLSAILLGRKKIQLINGNYKSIKQIKRSIYALLENAVAEGRNQTFIIGTKKAFFDRLWEQSQSEDTNQRNAKLQAKNIFHDQSKMKELESIYFGFSDKIRKVHEMIIRSARSDYPVIIIGPSGTGKEIVAQQIHNHSRRSHHPFIAVNCAAIPSELLEARLFGYKKGSFTGAIRDQAGFWEMADKGTLFLDEIGELTLAHQAKILRSIEEKMIWPIGAERAIEIDLRIISATNRNLFGMIKNGQFREDLYYRLEVFMIRTPALKEHLEDIPYYVDLLWEKIINEENEADNAYILENNRKLPSEVVKEIARQPWPGNVRQLKNILRKLYAMFGDIKEIKPKDVVEIINYEKFGHTDLTERVSILNTNKRAAEVIQSAQQLLNSMINNSSSQCNEDSFMHHLLKYHLDEIEELCSEPWLFLVEDTYFILDSLRAKIKYFSQILPRDSQKATSFWHKELSDTFQNAGSAVLKELEQLRDNA